MAKRAAPVTASAINVAKGLKKDVDLLQRYIQQRPPDAVELLERCIQDGAKKMRQAAFPLLAAIDVKRAETLALEQAIVGEQSRNPKERAERFAFLIDVATPACLDRAEALGVVIGTLFAHQLARAVSWLQRVLGRERERGTSAAWLRAQAGMFAYCEDDNAARDWLASLLDAPSTSEAERLALFEGLVESRYLPVLRRADIPDALVPSAAFAMPTSECFDRLAPFLDRLSLFESSTAFANANMMWQPADERWFDYWRRRADGAPAQHQLSALRALKDAARVEREAPIHARIDDASFDLLASLPWDTGTANYFSSPSVWKHPAAADVQMKGVAHASETYNEQGHRSLARMLQPLHEHGRAEHIPLLEGHARHVAKITNGSRAAAAWFADAITAIRRRVDRG